MAAFRHLGVGRKRAAPVPNSGGDAKSVAEPADRSDRRQVEADAFMDIVTARVGARERRGALAYLEIVGPHRVDSTEAYLDPMAPDTNYSGVFENIEQALGTEDSFCWFGGRFLILVDRAGTAARVLTRINRSIANREWQSNGEVAHLTPITGYLELRSATSVRDLWDMAEKALQRARSSLEVEPLRYVESRERRIAARSPLSFSSRWRAAPQWTVLTTQLVISLALGLGGPFVLYAICDALGADIAGSVYIGVVVVLVITATTIWIEGLLALKATVPPLCPGTPYPIATLIIPAYLPNEADTIMETLGAFLRLRYCNLVQIIVAYNSPTKYHPVEDEMKALAAEHAEGGRFLIEAVRVQNSTSKAQNVNAVIGRVKGRFVGIFDADHHPHTDSLDRAWRWLSNGWDIVQGRCAIRNGEESWVARMVAVEFEQIYAVSHPGRARFHGFGIFGGSNGFWRTSVLHETRMRQSMLTEDIDSSIRALVAGYKITGDRDLVSEELAPTTMKQLLNQRLRWAQGWCQVSVRRVVPALRSPHVSIRQKLGLLHLLVWRELFPWYSIQVVPIMSYWVWIYGWAYIHWTVPIFLATTIYTVSTGPGQVILAYRLAQKPMQRRRGWFIEYLLVSTFFYSPFKDALSRIAHVKEAMREKAWNVTPRISPLVARAPAMAVTSALVLLVTVIVPAADPARAASDAPPRRSAAQLISTYLGGEASTINAARIAARTGHNAQAAELFATAIRDVPRRRGALLGEYADSLSYAGRGAEAVPLYRELLASPIDPASRRNIEGRLALALTWSRQYGAALSTYNDLLRRAPNDPDFSIRGAGVLASLGRTDEAVAALDRVPPGRWASGQLAVAGEGVLVQAARSKAAAGQHAAAAALFRRVMAHDNRLGAALLPEYADQAARAKLPVATAAPLRTGGALASYRATLANAAPNTQAFRDAQHGLALALASTGASDAAIEAWSAYLRSAPGDVDALLHRAELLRQLHRDAQASDAFQAAFAASPQNKAARAGVVDTIVSLARAAAREDRNAEAATLFARALAIDPAKRFDLMREYADQLSFSDRAAQATPLYQEILASDTLPVIERQRAMIGLANAYAWSARPKEALACYDQLVIAYPGNPDLRWTRLVFAAREAARSDRNAEAANLFDQAITLEPARGGEVLREYADQLSFTNRAALAIPLYAKVAAQPDLTAADRADAETGLARAYEWSGRLDLAKATYLHLLESQPDDVLVQWKLLVVSAREAARDDDNSEASALFAKAIRLEPARSVGILREYADQLSFTNRSRAAVGFYQIALKQPTLTAADRAAGSRGLAQAYQWQGRYADAKEIYAALLADAPGDTLLQWNLLVVSARIAAAEDRNHDAAVLFAKAIRLRPDQRIVILKEYADKLVYSDQIKPAVPLYREVLRTKLLAGDLRDAALALAFALARERKFDDALAEYKRLVVADPEDVEAALGSARTLSWAGRQSDAKSAYGLILGRWPGNGEAQRGIAQAADWEGHHREAQALLTRRLQDRPDDLEARRLLAQSLVWSGRPDEALEEVHRAQQYQRSLAPSRRANTQRPDPRRDPSVESAPIKTGLVDQPAQLVTSNDR